MSRVLDRVLLAVAVVACLTAVVASAQDTTTTKDTKKFEVIAVEGNRLVVRLPEGTRELVVPEDFRFVVNGQPLSVHELKPGMAGTATITTRTTLTPVTVTEVKSGTVTQVVGSTIIVRTDEGMRMFTQGDVDKRGVTIIREGKPAELSQFRAGDKLTATIITSKPPRVVTEKEVQATVAGGGTPAAQAPAPAPASASASQDQPKAASLPKTASPLPLLGLVGVASLVTGLALTARRRRRER